MRDLLSRLAAGEVVVADGALGTLLVERGLPPGECPESFNLGREDLLEEIARSYAEAGAQIVTANTFGASPMKLARYGLEDRAEEVNRRGVEAARRGGGWGGWGGGGVLVAGSCGPCGRMLAPYGDADPGEVYASFERQARFLKEAGVDLVLVETMIDLEEAKLAVRAAKEACGGIPVLATMTFDPTPRGFFTIMGVDARAAAAGLAEAGADAVGSNCGNGIDTMVELAREFARHAEIPLIIQSNAGLPVVTGARVEYPESPELLARGACKLMQAGVSVIGGCCGTTPEHIRAIRAVVDSASPGAGG